MTSSSRPLPSVHHRSSLIEVPPTSPGYVIDFFEAPHRLLTESERTTQKSGMDRQIQEPASRRERFLDLAYAFEQGCYWLIWAAVLLGLALGMFGL
jgi:hypothetical protein